MTRWVPRCPMCGFDLTATCSVVGNETAPLGSEAYAGRQVHCPACGRAVVLSPATQWVRVA